MRSDGNGDEVDAAVLVAETWNNSTDRNTDGHLSVDFRGTVVTISDIQYGEENGVSWVDVWLGGKVGTPNLRIVNPATLVEDPHGTIVKTVVDERGSRRDYRYREDPVFAVAKTVAEVRSGT